MELADLIPKEEDIEYISYKEIEESDDILLWEKFYDYDHFVRNMKHSHISRINPSHRRYFPPRGAPIIPYNRERFFVDSNIVKKGKIVDVGCNTGAFLMYLHEQGYDRLWGVDCSRRVLDVADFLAKERDMNIAWIWSMAHKLPFRDNEFTTLHAANLLEHLLDPQIFLKEVFRVLEVSGAFIGDVPLIVKLDEAEKDTGHLVSFDMNSLAVLLRKFFTNVFVKRLSGTNPDGGLDTLVFSCVKPK